ncbi:unnamed protein product [Moneuplotes crassus]|uniref:Aldehyde dehydrogenase domain-containing protein n=1 Tax=Euplotes crassus TaxID=5936 RepID=A0AAD1UFW9_EUPCR|nr:unnamed protein product [Moneuplotes crassus]
MMSKTLTRNLRRSFGTRMMPKQTQLFIDGKWVNSANEGIFETINPYTAESITSVQRASVEDVDRAVDAARKAFDNGPWRRTSASERGDLLFKLSHLVKQNSEELEYLEALGNGKSVNVATAGCTVVMKTAEQTPLSALRVGELIKEAGFPDGVVNILSGFGEDAGAHLVRHPGVDKVAFTGSTEVGLNIMRNSSISGLKRVTLELGGKSPFIICKDANIEESIQQANFALFFNSGQVCIAASRLFVHEKIYDEFAEKSAKLASKAVLGNGLDPNTTQGPQISKEQQDKIWGYIQKGKQEGASCLTGGEEYEANNTEYGLAAGVVTQDIGRAFHIVNGLRVGIVFVNSYHSNDITCPFGGFKNSGIGRENGITGYDPYLDTKTVIMSRPEVSISQLIFEI